MKACKKPYEKMWSAYGTWFQNYFAVRAANLTWCGCDVAYWSIGTVCCAGLVWPRTDVYWMRGLVWLRARPADHDGRGVSEGVHAAE